MDQKALGKFILWGVIALVGWSFYSTLKHETTLAVQQERLKHIEEKILIDQRLKGIEASISTLRDP